MRCRNGVTETSFCDLDATASAAPLHPRYCVRRASGFVLTAYPDTTLANSVLGQNRGSVKSSYRMADHTDTIHSRMGLLWLAH